MASEQRTTGAMNEKLEIKVSSASPHPHGCQVWPFHTLFLSSAPRLQRASSAHQFVGSLVPSTPLFFMYHSCIQSKADQCMPRQALVEEWIGLPRRGHTIGVYL